MPIGILNPKDNADAASVRPAHVNALAAVRRWFSAAARRSR